jgi:hypothetical protein
MTPRLATIRLAGTLLAAILLGCACSGTAATGSAEASAAPAVTVASTATDAPTPTPTPEPTATVAPTKGTPLPPASATPTTPPATPAPLPNLTSGTPVLTPSNPTCAVSFNIDAVITNSGAGPSLGAARVAVTAVRTTDGWIGLKEFQDIPPLAAGSHVHVNMDVTISRAGSFELAITADSNLWVPETHEDDNVSSKKIAVAYGTCGKS